MRRQVGACVALLRRAGDAIGYTKRMKRGRPRTPPPMRPEAEQADAVLVIKSARTLHLMRQGAILRSYRISLGAAPTGHKTCLGDQRTPEGEYLIDWRNQASMAHLSLHISYPDAADRAAAQAAGVHPGGNVMIHGLTNGWGFLAGLHMTWDWTNGCIGVTNADIRDIWSRVPDGTPITIRAQA